jgi:excisionase family DNA binding protein
VTNTTPRKTAFTTGEVARICNVTKRTVIKWIDSGRLKGYVIPGSAHRRVPADALAAFMRTNHIPDTQAALPRPRILIVDDDRDFAELLTDALRDHFEVQTAGSALEAASRLPVFRPDAILLDIRLPDLSGLDVCRHFQAYRRESGAPILCMSAYGHELDVAEIRRSGADDFLPKPLKITELKRQLQTMVG